MSKLAMYCVMCGVRSTSLNGVKTCPKSELELTHLWAQVGYIEDWFPVKVAT